MATDSLSLAISFNLSARLLCFNTLPDEGGATTMLMTSIVRQFRLFFGLLLAALLLQWLILPVKADELSDFHAAVEQASAQYNVALTTLETRGQDETAAEVHRLRQSWQLLLDRFQAQRPLAFAN